MTRSNGLSVQRLRATPKRIREAAETRFGRKR